MKRLALALFLMLPACAHVQTRIQTVYCVTPEQYKKLVAAEPGKVGNSGTGLLDFDYRVSVKQNILMRQYADGLLEVIGGCMSHDK